jgi:transposase
VRRTWAPRGKTPVLPYWYLYDKITAIGDLAVSPKRTRIGLYLHLLRHNATGIDIRCYLKYLQRHLRGPITLLWDGGTIHRRRCVKDYLADHPEMEVYGFPGYAPELNPAEFVWSNTKHHLANATAPDLDDLHRRLCAQKRRLRKNPSLLWAAIEASDLPWP